VTVDAVVGNMPLKDDSSPKTFRPDCIFIDFKRWVRGGMLNAVGLSNFGVEHYLKKGLWQKRTKPFAISLMLVRGTREERVQEAREFVEIMMRYLDEFGVLPILKLNISCSNTSHDVCGLVGEQREILGILAPLGLEIIVKVNALSDVDSVWKIADHAACKGICVSNTLPWAELPDWIKWKIFPEFTELPLAKYDGGGFSGKDVLPIVVAWIARARQAGITKPIIGGGGIFTPVGVWRMYQAGASAISIGSPLLFRPWMILLNIPTAFVLFKLFSNR
jgi:dihydroorotate dehydrogenase